MQSHFYVLKLDETENWCQEVKDKAKRILGIYLFDKTRHVHCCEFTPSYECIFIESQWENLDLSDNEQEELDDLIQEGNRETNNVNYYHTYVIDDLPLIKEGQVARGIIDLGIDNEEEALEYLAYNGV